MVLVAMCGVLENELVSHAFVSISTVYNVPKDLMQFVSIMFPIYDCFEN